MYDREATPFVPDYKFLSNVLETRQSRYDQNYQALSEAYGKVVYADLSREDNQNKRDQFAQQIAPKMSQISGYDLSLRQNVDMAKGVFAPFYEDQEILRDLTNTANYKYGARYSDALKNSLDKEQRDMYWDEGRMDLDIQMQKYLDASPEQALNMTIGNYVPNPNLYEYALELLNEQGFEVKADRIDPETGRWIITQKNGDLVTDVAYSYLNRALMDDPRVIEGYKVKSRVDAHNFASNGVNTGQFQSIAEGEEFWARQTIQDITTAQALLLKDDKAEAERIGKQAAGWEQHMAQYNYPEDHSAVQKAQTWQDRYLAAVGVVDQRRDLVNTGISAQERGSNQDLMSKAFMMYMGANIQDDLAAAAKTYSMKDYEVTIDENPYGLAQYKGQIDYQIRSQLQKEKAELDWINKQNELLMSFSLTGQGQDKQPGYVVSAPGETAGETDFSDIFEMDQKTNQQFTNGTTQRMVDFIINHHTFTESLQNGDASTFTINVGGIPKKFNSLLEAKNFLMQDENTNLRMELYKKAADDLKVPKEGEENRYGFVVDEVDIATLANLRKQPGVIQQRINLSNSVKRLHSQNMYDNLLILQKLDANGNKDLLAALNGVKLRVSDDFRSMTKRNIPMPFFMNDDGSVRRMQTRDEFIQEITRIAATPGQAVYQNDGETPYTDFDDLAEDMGKIYDQIVFAANATANGKVDAAYGLTGKTSPFKRSSETEFYFNVDPANMTGASGIQHQGYVSNFNPMRPEGSKADADFRVALNTINTNYSLLGYQFGDIKNLEDVDYQERDQEAFNMIQALTQSVNTYYEADRDTNGNRKTTGLGTRPDFQIQYNPILKSPESEDRVSGYVLRPSDDWVRDYYSNQGYTGDDLTDEIKSFKDNGGAITITVDPELDLNPKSLKNTLAGGPVSMFDFEMNTSADRKSIIDDYAESAGTLEVYKDQNGMYMFQQKNMKTFNSETGEYINLPGVTARPLLDQNMQAVTVNNLDDAIRALTKQLEQRSKMNLEARKNYLASIKK